MKIIKQKHFPTQLIAIVAIIAVLACAGAVYLIGFKGSLFGWQPFAPTPVPSSQPTQSSTDTSHGTKDGTTGTNQTTDQIPVSKDVTATFTTLTQSGGYVTFSGSANDTAAGGNCSIVFTNPNDRPVTRTVSATQQGGKAVCGPVQVPETEFSFLGEWTATFRYYTNDTQAVAERTITIR